MTEEVEESFPTAEIPAQEEVDDLPNVEDELVQIKNEENEERQTSEESISFCDDNGRVPTPEAYFCRICHSRNQEERNLTPCNCRGTMGFIHRSCLERWLVASDSNSCELCGYKFTVNRTPKYHIFKAISIWLQNEECRKDRLFLVVDAIRLMATLPLILLANHQTTMFLEMFNVDNVIVGDMFSLIVEDAPMEINFSSLQEIGMTLGRFLSYFVVGAVSALDVLTIGWVYMRVEGHYFQWQRWYRSQCVLSVVLPEQSIDNSK